MDKTVDIGAQSAMYGGAGTGLWFGMFSTNELAAITGAIVAVIGLVVQVWHVRQKNRRAEELHRLTLEEIRNGNQTKNQDAE